MEQLVGDEVNLTAKIEKKRNELERAGKRLRALKGTRLESSHCARNEFVMERVREVLRSSRRNVFVLRSRVLFSHSLTLCLAFSVVRPAFMDEYEKLEKELRESYGEYVNKFRNVSFLENQLEEMQKVDRERFAVGSGVCLWLRITLIILYVRVCVCVFVCGMCVW